jgi:hypothetical protein
VYVDYKQGHRLGTTDDNNKARLKVSVPVGDDVIPEPLFDKSLSDDDRAKIRADRAAAAEARIKKQGGTITNKKSTSASSSPLRGPTSEPLMRWTAG